MLVDSVEFANEITVDICLFILLICQSSCIFAFLEKILNMKMYDDMKSMLAKALKFKDIPKR
jgi:hypothetical protein